MANPAGDLIHVQAAVHKQGNIGMPQGVKRHQRQLSGPNQVRPIAAELVRPDRGPLDVRENQGRLRQLAHAELDPLLQDLRPVLAQDVACDGRQGE